MSDSFLQVQTKAAVLLPILLMIMEAMGHPKAVSREERTKWTFPLVQHSLRCFGKST